MARAVITSRPERRPTFEPLYDVHPDRTETLEVFFVDQALAQAFGTGSVGFWWWTCRIGGLPSEPHGLSPPAIWPTGTRWAGRGGHSAAVHIFQVLHKI